MTASLVAILSIQISQHRVVPVTHFRWGGDLCSRYIQDFLRNQQWSNFTDQSVNF